MDSGASSVSFVCNAALPRTGGCNALQAAVKRDVAPLSTFVVRRRVVRPSRTPSRAPAPCASASCGRRRRAAVPAGASLQLAHTGCVRQLGAQLVNLGDGLTPRARCCAQGAAAAMAECSESDGAMAGAARGLRVLPRRPGELTAALVGSTPWAPAQARLRACAGGQRRAGPEAARAFRAPLRGPVGRKAHGRLRGCRWRRHRGALAFRRRQRSPGAFASRFGVRAGGSESCRAPRGAAGCA